MSAFASIGATTDSNKLDVVVRPAASTAEHAGAGASSCTQGSSCKPESAVSMEVPTGVGLGASYDSETCGSEGSRGARMRPRLSDGGQSVATADSSGRTLVWRPDKMERASSQRSQQGSSSFAAGRPSRGKEMEEWASSARQLADSLRLQCEQSDTGDECLMAFAESGFTPVSHQMRAAARAKWTVSLLAAGLIAMQTVVMEFVVNCVTHLRLLALSQISTSRSGTSLPTYAVLQVGFGLVACVAASCLALYAASPSRQATFDTPCCGCGTAAVKACFRDGACAFTGGSHKAAGQNANVTRSRSHPSLSKRLWFARSLGAMLVASSGLFSDARASMAHIGAVVTTGIGVGRFSEGGIHIVLPWCMQEERSQAELLAMGAAIGWAAGFGAPVGALVFSLEELSSAVWPASTTWRIFCACVASVCCTRAARWKLGEPVALFVVNVDVERHRFSMLDYVLCACLGLVCGMSAALFSSVGLRARQLHRSVAAGCRYSSGVVRLLAVTGVVLPCILACVLAPMLSSRCEVCSESSGCTDLSDDRGLFRADCPLEEQSVLAGLLWPSGGSVLTRLFNTAEHHIASDGLLLSGCVLGLVSALCGCLDLPYSPWVAQLCVGACIGRVCAQTLHLVLGHGYSGIPAGIFAFLCAAGQLGSYMRLPLPVSITMLEIAGSPALLLPLFLTVGIANVVAEWLVPEGLLESPSELNVRAKLVESDWDVPGSAALSIYDACLTKADAIHALHSFDRLAMVVKLVDQTPYAAFPVVDDKEPCVVGVVERQRLEALIATHKTSPLVVQATVILNILGPRDKAPDVMHWRTPLSKAFAHFRAAGLRRVCLVDDRHRLMGMVTRSDLARLRHVEQCHRLLGELQSPPSWLHSENSLRIHSSPMSQTTSQAAALRLLPGQECYPGKLNPSETATSVGDTWQEPSSLAGTYESLATSPRPSLYSSPRSIKDDGLYSSPRSIAQPAVYLAPPIPVEDEDDGDEFGGEDDTMPVNRLSRRRSHFSRRSSNTSTHSMASRCSEESARSEIFDINSLSTQSRSDVLQVDAAPLLGPLVAQSMAPVPLGPNVSVVASINGRRRSSRTRSSVHRTSRMQILSKISEADLEHWGDSAKPATSEDEVDDDARTEPEVNDSQGKQREAD
eukprot:TRINITY_DN41763_c0_g1_i1.p1 TRINITY_DN41763_c0_g1~~TRINITY_DN41763_c0_g1_i1.p1  ORF type:complete len:1140 (+),score=147.87 TRINITY_DN41763_c0_g1_i1:101-3520(+)